MLFPILTMKTESLYFAYTPEWGVVSYGTCQDEAVNNLQDQVRLVQLAGIEEIVSHDR
jgi:hypothetical protein